MQQNFAVNFPGNEKIFAVIGKFTMENSSSGPSNISYELFNFAPKQPSENNYFQITARRLI